jgi:hypothetical protein
MPYLFRVFQLLNCLSSFDGHIYEVKNKTFSEELIVYFPLIPYGLHRKRRLQQFFVCYACFCCRDNVITEPLHSNDKGLHIRTHRLMGRDLLCTPLRWAELP